MRKLRFRELLPGVQSTLGLTPARRLSQDPQATIVFPGEAQPGAESPGGAAHGGPPPRLGCRLCPALRPGCALQGTGTGTGSQQLVPGAPQGQPTAHPRLSDFGLCSPLVPARDLGPGKSKGPASPSGGFLPPPKSPLLCAVLGTSGGRQPQLWLGKLMLRTEFH